MLVNCESHHVLQVGLAQMLKGGVIMDVTNVEEARIAEEAGAVAVMALERVPAGVPLQFCCMLLRPPATFISPARSACAHWRGQPMLLIKGDHIAAQSLWRSLTDAQHEQSQTGDRWSTQRWRASSLNLAKTFCPQTSGRTAAWRG